MQPYDSSLFTPPAPLARVSLRDLESGASVQDVPLLLDTGADVTLLPRSSVERLGIAVNPTEGYELTGFDGSKSMASSVRLTLVFLERRFKGQFLITEQDWGILGRDVLNHLRLVFDGPRLCWGDQK